MQKKKAPSTRFGQGTDHGRTSGVADRKPRTTPTALFAFALPVLIYIQTLGFGYTRFDDDQMISDQITFLSDFSNTSQAFITDQFITGTGSFYRPLGTFSYMTDILLSGGDNPWMFHFTNVLLFGLIGLSLFLLLKRLAIPQKAALLGTLLFTAHPLFVSTVAHIPNRAELLLILFSLLSMLFLSAYATTKKFSLLLLHFVSFGLALFSKETAAFLPLLFGFYLLLKQGKKTFSPTFLILVPLYALAGGAWYALRHQAIAGHPVDPVHFGLDALLINLRIVPESIARLFQPYNLAPIPSFSVFNVVAGCILFTLILLYAFIITKNARKEKLFSLAWFLLLLTPSLLFKHPNFDYLDHRFFLPMTGILMIILTSLPEKFIGLGGRKTTWVTVILIAGLTIITVEKSRAYHDPMRFYNTAIRYNDRSDMAYHNRAVLLENKRQYQLAIKDYSRALELNPAFDKAWFNRGALYEKQGAFDLAIADYSMAIKVKPDYFDAYINRGNIYSQQSNYEKALADYTRVSELNPSYLMAYNNKGTVYGKQNLYDQAIAEFTQALKLDPAFAEGYHNRGMMYGNKGMFNEALVDFSKAIEIAPAQADNFIKRGMVYSALGNNNKACQDFDHAMTLGAPEAASLRSIHCH